MKRQSGITLIGFVIILVIAAFFIYTAMKLVPAYMDYFNVAKAMNTVASQSSGGTSQEQLRRQLETQQLSQYFDDEDIAAENIHVVTNPKGGSLLKLSYDKKIPWIYNIDFLLHFEKTVPLQAPTSG
ncbi:MAG TPA: DUF4845 domain-containing protein [Rhodanobacteraceae bacterium]|nr:DUF4845 domain-containing protein [Rhodanobacteraceae bacterium]